MESSEDPVEAPLPQIRLQCFGSPALRSLALADGGKVLLPAGKPLLILTYLACCYPKSASRDHLSLLGWGDSDEGHARASLRQAIYRIRAAIGNDAIASDAHSVRLTIDLPSDWALLSEAVRLGDDAALINGCKGDFLEGIDAGDPDALGDWISAESGRWSRLLSAAVLREGQRALGSGEVAKAIALAERALARDIGGMPEWGLLLEALRTSDMPSRLEDGVARLESAGEHGLLDVANPSQWRRLVRRYRHSFEEPEAEGGESARTLTAGQLPFTGRGALWSHLTTLLTRPTVAVHRTIAMIAGPGFGKSRMLRELKLGLAGRPLIVVQVDAIAAEATIPWALLNRIVETLAALPEARGIDPQSAARLVTLNPHLRDRFPGTPSADRIPGAGELTAALADLLGAAGDALPLVLFIDDLHWADDRSLAVLRDALSQAAAGRTRCLVAARDDASHLLPAWHMIHLPSLTAEALEALINVALPAIPAAQLASAAYAMLLVTGGVPHYVVRALQRLQAIDSTLHPTDDTRCAQLLSAIPSLELYRDTAFPTSVTDRSLLEYLAVAGEWVTKIELRAVLASSSQPDIEASLARLQQLGWLVSDETAARLSHNLVEQQVIEGLPTGQHRVLALQRAHWLADQGFSLHQIQSAVRLCLAQGAESQALAAVRTWCRRMRGGIRGRGFAELVLPPDTDRALRWKVSAAATPALLWWVVVGGGLVALLVWSGFGWVVEPTTLRLENVPRVQPTELGGEVLRNSEPPLFTIRDRSGHISKGLDGKPLRIVGMSATMDSLRLNPLPVVRNGRVSADSLAVYTHQSDSLQVTFQVGELAPLTVTVFRGFADQSLTITGGQLEGQVFGAVRPEVTVSPGDSLRGSLFLRYSTPAQSALWILGGTSTMGVPSEDTTSVVTLHAGTPGALVEVVVRRRAPLVPGHYWLLWTFAAEPAARWIFSLTNWKCGTPHWNDHNDFLPASEVALEGVWGGGYLDLRREICDGPGGSVSGQQLMHYPTATLRVTVR